MEGSIYGGRQIRRAEGDSRAQAVKMVQRWMQSAQSNRKQPNTEDIRNAVTEEVQEGRLVNLAQFFSTVGRLYC